MLFHGWIKRRFEADEAELESLRVRVLKLETKVMVTQQQLDDLTAAVNKAVSDIQAEIAALKALNPALDLTGLSAAVAGLQALDAANTPPAPPTP